MDFEHNSSTPLISEPHYRDLIVKAHERIADSSFDLTAFVQSEQSKFKGQEGAGVHDRSVIAVTVSETLGQLLADADHMEDVDGYVKVKETLQSMDEQDRSFLRTCIRLADFEAVRVLPKDEVAASALSAAQLMAILI